MVLVPREGKDYANRRALAEVLETRGSVENNIRVDIVLLVIPCVWHVEARVIHDMYG